jgi:hypothetical protein
MLLEKYRPLESAARKSRYFCGGKMLRQRTACRLACGSSKHICRCWWKFVFCLLTLLRTACLQIFQLQFELFKLPLDFLRLAAKLQPLQTRNHQPETLQFSIMREDLCVLLHSHFPQRGCIQRVQVRQRRNRPIQTMPCFRYLVELIANIFG